MRALHADYSAHQTKLGHDSYHADWGRYFERHLWDRKNPRRPFRSKCPNGAKSSRTIRHWHSQIFISQARAEANALVIVANGAALPPRNFDMDYTEIEAWPPHTSKFATVSALS